MTDLLSTIRAEIDVRLRELRPIVAEYERLTSATDALVAGGRAARQPRGEVRRAAKKPSRPVRRKRARSAPNPTGQAILAALEHGSHTVAELVVVTALPTPELRDGLRDLRRRRAIVRTDRDGRSAYALPTPAA
ncbi:MAG TPA: hypothetical protein VGH60_01370 [Solirubrobacteraceae bacterium]|jgi:hypothetical protein